MSFVDRAILRQRMRGAGKGRPVCSTAARTASIAAGRNRPAACRRRFARNRDQRAAEAEVLMQRQALDCEIRSCIGSAQRMKRDGVLHMLGEESLDGSQSHWRARCRESPAPRARSATVSSSRRRAGPSRPAACPGRPANALSIPANRSPAQNPPNPSASPEWRNVPLVRSCPACRPRLMSDVD